MSNTMNLSQFGKVLAELSKVRITFFVAISSSIGYILAAGTLTWLMLLPTFGVFLLASGSSALNHYQERETDKMMERTKSRPIPAGKISPGAALVISLVLILIGSIMLYYSSNVTALLLGLFTMLWYNVFYTPMKKKFALVVVPGSLVGAIPPVIGWTAAGRGLFEPQILALAMFFFIWQIPHFWLLLLMYGEDYEQAGFPTLTKVFTNMQLSRVTYVWIAALAFSSLLIPLFSVASNLIVNIILVVMGFALLYQTKSILNTLIERKVFRSAFMSINIYVLLVMMLLSLDTLAL